MVSGLLRKPGDQGPLPATQLGFSLVAARTALFLPNLTNQPPCVVGSDSARVVAPCPTCTTTVCFRSLTVERIERYVGEAKPGLNYDWAAGWLQSEVR